MAHGGGAEGAHLLRMLARCTSRAGEFQRSLWSRIPHDRVEQVCSVAVTSQGPEFSLYVSVAAYSGHQFDWSFELTAGDASWTLETYVADGADTIRRFPERRAGTLLELESTIDVALDELLRVDGFEAAFARP